MAIKGQDYVLEFTLRDTNGNRYVSTDESANITVSQSIDGADFVVLSASVLPVKKNNALTGVYKVNITLSGDTNAFLIEHTSLTPEPDTILVLTDKAYVSGIKAKTDLLTFTAGNVHADAKVVSDKANYTLTSGEHTLIQGDVQTGLTNQGYTVVRASKLDNLDTAITSRLASSDYVPPDNAGIAAIKLQTDKMTFTGTNINADAKVVSDKVGYALTSGEHTAIQGDVQSGLTAQGYTAGRAPKLDNLDAAVSSRSTLTAADVWSHTTRTLTSFGTLVSDVATAVWATVVDGGKTALGLMRLFASAMLGKVSGAQTNTPVFRDIADTKNRITMTVDNDGNRTGVTLDDS